MFFRLSGVITAALIGLGNSGSPIFAQYHAAPVYPSPQHGLTPHPPDAELHVRYRGDPRNIAALSTQARPETRPRNGSRLSSVAPSSNTIARSRQGRSSSIHRTRISTLYSAMARPCVMASVSAAQG